MSARCAVWDTTTRAESDAVRVQLQPAYLLHRRPYRDSSDLLDIFSAEHGRQGLVARGLERKRRGGSLAALLQPFRPVLLSFSGRGELKALRGAEQAGGTLPALRGEALLVGFYVNELLQRLLPRGEEHSLLFAAYAEVLERLASARDRDALQSGLRRFEFTLLERLGYAVDFHRDALHGDAFSAGALYRLVPERGFLPLYGVAEGSSAYRGADLLALGEGRLQDAAAPAKRIVRQLLQAHLGSRPLRSRGMFMAGEARLARDARPQRTGPPAADRPACCGQARPQRAVWQTN